MRFSLFDAVHATTGVPRRLPKKKLACKTKALGVCALSLVATVACQNQVRYGTLFDWNKNGVLAYDQVKKEVLGPDDAALDDREAVYVQPLDEQEIKWKKIRNERKAEQFRSFIKRYSDPAAREEHYAKFFKVQTPGEGYWLPGLKDEPGLFATTKLKAGQTVDVYGGILLNRGLVDRNKPGHQRMGSTNPLSLGNDYVRWYDLQTSINPGQIERTISKLGTGYEFALGDYPYVQKLANGTSTHMRVILTPLVDEEKTFLSPGARINSYVGPDEDPEAHRDRINTDFRWVKIPGQLPKLVFFTTQEIEEGDQLFLDYLGDYWESRQLQGKPGFELAVKNAAAQVEQINKCRNNENWASRFKQPQRVHSNLTSEGPVVTDTAFFGLAS